MPGGHLMQHGMVDVVHRRHRPHDRARATSPTRSAPTSRRSQPSDNGVPFYVALPHPTIDWTIRDGVQGDPDRAARPGRGAPRGRPDARRRGCSTSRSSRRAAPPPTSPSTSHRPASSPRLITDRGVCEASEQGLPPFPDLATRDECGFRVAGSVLDSPPRLRRWRARKCSVLSSSCEFRIRPSKCRGG